LLSLRHVLSIQLFITILEFKLTTLAGFVLVPFALWNRTGFLAERVLGNVVSSGIKVMVLAVIVGIGSGFFDEFAAAGSAEETTLAEGLASCLPASPCGNLRPGGAGAGSQSRDAGELPGRRQGIRTSAARATRLILMSDGRTAAIGSAAMITIEEFAQLARLPTRVMGVTNRSERTQA
jgi:type IV secretion system protein TrbL